MEDNCRYILCTLSDAEMLTYWSLFAEYPTRDARQRRRMDELLNTIGREKTRQRTLVEHGISESAAAIEREMERVA